MISRHLAELYEKSNGTKVHLVAHSFCGVDARAAISLFGANEYVQSLTTVCSPHHGMKFVDTCNAKPNRYSIDNFDKIFDALGMS